MDEPDRYAINVTPPPRSGWWLMLLISFDALWRMR